MKLYPGAGHTLPPVSSGCIGVPAQAMGAQGVEGDCCPGGQEPGLPGQLQVRLLWGFAPRAVAKERALFYGA